MTFLRGSRSSSMQSRKIWTRDLKIGMSWVQNEMVFKDRILPEGNRRGNQKGHFTKRNIFKIFFWDCWKAPVSDSGTKRINTKKSVSEVLSENLGSKMAIVFFHSWRAPDSNKKETKSSSSKRGVRENLQTQNTHKDCQKPPRPPQKHRGVKTAEGTCGEAGSKAWWEASRNTLPEGRQDQRRKCEPL